MFAGCSDECIKAIIKAKQGKGVYPSPNPRPRPKRPINLPIKEPKPISIRPIPKDVIKKKKKLIIPELNQQETINNKLEPAKKTIDTRLYKNKSNITTTLDKDRFINTELEENDNKVSETELEENDNKVSETELEENDSEVSETELEENDNEESNKTPFINNELNVGHKDTPKSWYNTPIFNKYFT